MHHTVKYQDKITHPKLLILKPSIHFSMVYEHLEKLTILFYFIYLMIQAMKGVDNIPHPYSKPEPYQPATKRTIIESWA